MKGLKCFAALSVFILLVSFFSTSAYAGSWTKNYSDGNYSCTHTASISSTTVSGSATVRYTASGSAYMNVRITGYAYDYSGQILGGYDKTYGEYGNEVSVSDSKAYMGNGQYTYATVSYVSYGPRGQKVYL